MKILMADSFDKSLPGRLSKFGDVFTEMEKIGEADVILVRSKTKVTEELVQKAPNLKLVIRGGVGLDNVDKKACDAKKIKESIVKVVLHGPDARVDYVEIVDDRTLEPVETIDRRCLIALAVYVGKTRLIDNLVIGGAR